jgi:hypothetical protein
MVGARPGVITGVHAKKWANRGGGIPRHRGCSVGTALARLCGLVAVIRASVAGITRRRNTPPTTGCQSRAQRPIVGRPPVAAVYDRRPRLTDRINFSAVIDHRYNSSPSGPAIERAPVFGAGLFEVAWRHNAGCVFIDGSLHRACPHRWKNASCRCARLHHQRFMEGSGKIPAVGARQSWTVSSSRARPLGVAESSNPSGRRAVQRVRCP